MFIQLKKLYHWMGTCVYSPHAQPLLAVLFFVEAIFFLPTDPMLIMYCIECPRKAYRFATIATLSSVLGGLTGYAIGYWLWINVGQQIIHNPLVNYIMTPETFTHLCGLYKKHEAFAVLLAAFTPIPYKAATLTAGFCNLSIPSFIIASCIGRGARFYLYAVLISIWGKHMKEYIDKYFNILVCLAMVLIAGALYLLKR